MAAKTKKIKKENVMQGWKVKTLQDAFAPRPPREYAVVGLFPFHTLNIVFGIEGSMKSLLMMDMALCISEGLPWLAYEDGNNYKFETNKCNVLYIDCDNGSLTDDERINAFAISHGLAADEKSSFKYISMPDSFDISGKETLDKISIITLTLETKVLVLDNLGLINSRDENSPEMAKVMSNLRILADRGICVIVVHHQRKSNGGQPAARLGETLRGHSSIAAALDFSYFISRKDVSDNNITITPSKCRFAPVQPFGAKFVYTWIEETSELETAAFRCHDILNELEKALSALPILLAPGEITQSELVKALMLKGISQRVSKEAIAKGIEDGYVKWRKGAHNSTLLSYAENINAETMPIMEKLFGKK